MSYFGRKDRKYFSILQIYLQKCKEMNGFVFNLGAVEARKC